MPAFSKAEAQDTAGTLSVPLRTGWSAVRRALFFLTVPVVVAGLSGLFGWQHYRLDRARLRQTAWEQLGAIADLKVSQITAWRNERLSDARFLSMAPFVARDCLALLRNPDDLDARRQVREWLEVIQGGPRYTTALVLGQDLDAVMTLPGPARVVEPPLREYAAKVLQEGTVWMSDLHGVRSGDPFHLEVLAPIRKECTGGSEEPVLSAVEGVIVLRIDPRHALFPILVSWPIPGTFGRALLVRKEGPEVRILNPAREGPGTRTPELLPISLPDLPAARAARGEDGPCEGYDERGTPVLAVIRRVPDSPWVLLTEIDSIETFAPLRRAAWRTAGLSALVFTALGCLTVLWGRARREGELRRAWQVERENRLLNERLQMALAAVNQGVFDLNVATGEAEVSPEYLRMLGYEPGEIRETNAAWRERMHPDDREQVYQVYRDYVAGRILEYRVEFRQRTKRGDWIWILSLGKIVARDQAGQPLRMIGTHTDITDRKRIEFQMADQLRELQRWHEVMLGRESRILELKRHINELRARLGLPPAYPSAEPDLPGDHAPRPPTVPPFPPVSGPAIDRPPDLP